MSKLRAAWCPEEGCGRGLPADMPRRFAGPARAVPAGGAFHWRCIDFVLSTCWRRADSWPALSSRCSSAASPACPFWRGVSLRRFPSGRCRHRCEGDGGKTSANLTRRTSSKRFVTGTVVCARSRPPASCRASPARRRRVEPDRGWPPGIAGKRPAQPREQVRRRSRRGQESDGEAGPFDEAARAGRARLSAFRRVPAESFRPARKMSRRGRPRAGPDTALADCGAACGGENVAAAFMTAFLNRR